MSTTQQAESHGAATAASLPENPPAYREEQAESHGAATAASLPENAPAYREGQQRQYANYHGPYQGGYYPAPVTTQVAYYPTPSAAPYGPAMPGAVIISPPGIYVNKPMGPGPELLTCKACHATIVTRITRKPTIKTHLCAAVCCLIGFWPCACCLYCCHDCLAVEHYCPNCDAYLGTFDK